MMGKKADDQDRALASSARRRTSRIASATWREHAQFRSWLRSKAGPSTEGTSIHYVRRAFASSGTGTRIEIPSTAAPPASIGSPPSERARPWRQSRTRRRSSAATTTALRQMLRLRSLCS